MRLTIRPLLALLLLLIVACSSSSNDAAPAADAGDDGGTPGDDTNGDGGPSNKYPAFTVNAPQLINRGGPVMTTPTIVPVFYPNDAEQAKIVSFLNDTSVGPALDADVAEYGIGHMSIGTPITHTTAASSNMTDGMIRTELTNGTTQYPGGLGNLYVFYMPSTQVTFSRGATTLCGQIGGFHDAVIRGDGTPVIYAVIPRCTKFAYFFDFDAVTTTTVHEVAEAVTDPLSGSKTPGWLIIDTNHAGIGLVAAGFNNILNQENGDLCTPTSSLDVAKLGTFALPLLWSNAAAKAGHDPCTGPGTRLPYFNMQAVLTNNSPVNVPSYAIVGLPTSFTAPNVLAKVGQTATVQLQAFSDAPTSGPWTIQGGDFTDPQKPILTVKLDKDKVQNGDVVTASIIVPGNANSGTYVVAVISKLVNQLRYTGFLVRVL